MVHHQCWIEVEGMSDLSIYELEDIIWDDFDRSDDHIVPHPSNDHGTKDKYEGDSCKKPRHEVAPLQSNESDDYASGSVCQVKEKRDPAVLNKERNMLEKDSWSHTPEGVFASSGDAETGKDTPTVQSGDTKISNHCFKSSNYTSGSEVCTDEGTTAVDSNSYSFPPNRICQSHDLDLFSNDDGKESSNLLYYGWPDIPNFEDVDRMLSNCDSSFGLGITGDDDELVWFTSEDQAGGYEEALKEDLKFRCSEPSALTNLSQDHGPRNNKRSGFMYESEDEFKLKDQHVNLLKEEPRQQNQAEEKKAGQCFGDYCLKSNDIQISSDQVFTSIDNEQRNKNSGHDSFGCMQSNTYLHPGRDHRPMQPAGGEMMIGIKYEKKGTSPAQKETDNATSQVQSMGISGDPSFKVTTSEMCRKIKAHHSHASESSVSENQKQADTMLQALRSDLVSSQTQSCTPETKIESQTDMEGIKKRTSAELGLLDEPEGSSVSSELDEISLEATSFRQLQEVMEQLDLRTKLCIRDSLYRLARSAEQRHNYGGTGGTNKYTGFMDMETDTNPIDRTVAHLLFHRPSDVPIPWPLKPNAKVHGSATENQSFHEEGANQSGDKDFKNRKQLTCRLLDLKV